ncbi:uncharacterized protein BDW70DRAFT_94726 [Aspergillus foveolatus]|uniref:uncharacterized protein n=1 Tax=Aspergillus foveolatus TaxID=210207 RepID=UPI003CCE3D94
MVMSTTNAAPTPSASASAPQTANSNGSIACANPVATLTGTCPCGSISVTVTDRSLEGKPGQRDSNPNLTIDAEKTAIQDRQKTLKMYFDLDTMSGRQIEKFFCSSCGCPVMSMTALLPGQVNLTMGLFPRIPASGFETTSSAFQPYRHQHPHPRSLQGRLDDAVQWSAKANAGLA